jgi:cell division protein FtsW
MIKKDTTTLTIFLIIIAILTLIGLVFIYSSSSIYALEKTGSAHYYVKKQFLGIIIGLIVLLTAALMPLSVIKKVSPFLFLAALLLTALTLIPGIGCVINGSRRWLMLGSFNFQPSELLKIATLLYLAAFIDKKEYHLTSFTHGYVPFLFIIGIACATILPQPDFGQAVTLAATAFIIFFIAMGSIKHLFYTIIPAALGALLLIYLKPYRFKRILIFLNPWEDPKGSGFQIIQSLIAIGSGKWTGVGITHSKQKFFYLPMQHTDFIFSIIAEETGFIGTALLIFLFILFLFFGCRLAWRMKSTFAHLVTLSFVMLITLQTIINIYVTTGMAPTKGIGLPFISYGSSAIVCNLLMVGIIINCFYEDTV